MAITKAEVLAEVNARLNRSETDIDESLKTALKKLSGAGDFLAHTATASLVSGTKYIAEPDDFKTLVAIVLNDGTDDGKPLKLISFADWLKRREDEASASYDEPMKYAHWLKRFYMEPVSDDDYTATIYFYRYHTDALTTILFADAWREAIYSLTSYYVAKRFSLGRYMTIYGGNDELALQLALSHVAENEAKQPHFVEYHDM